jgi:hypothetical protein
MEIEISEVHPAVKRISMDIEIADHRPFDGDRVERRAL